MLGVLPVHDSEEMC